ncbi:MAG: hypothetical protein ACPGEC_00585 [Flavobacteriales bacterium]
MKLFICLLFATFLSLSPEGFCSDLCADTQHSHQNEAHHDEHQHHEDKTDDDNCCTQCCSCLCCSINQFQLEQRVVLSQNNLNLVIPSNFPIKLNLYTFEVHSKLYHPPKTA